MGWNEKYQQLGTRVQERGWSGVGNSYYLSPWLHVLGGVQVSPCHLPIFPMSFKPCSSPWYIRLITSGWWLNKVVLHLCHTLTNIPSLMLRRWGKISHRTELALLKHDTHSFRTMSIEHTPCLGELGFIVNTSYDVQERHSPCRPPPDYIITIKYLSLLY